MELNHNISITRRDKQPCFTADIRFLVAGPGFEPGSPVPKTGRLTKKRNPQNSGSPGGPDPFDMPAK